jgi:type IV secretory pathway VirJ component
VSLLSPEPSTAFEVEPSGWFGRQADATTPIVPELTKLTGFPVQCIYGEDEASDSLCTQAVGPGVHSISKSGGHHFDEDYGALADQILAALVH